MLSHVDNKQQTVASGGPGPLARLLPSTTLALGFGSELTRMLGDFPVACCPLPYLPGLGSHSQPCTALVPGQFGGTAAFLPP